MNIEFKPSRLKKLCTIESKARGRYGDQCAEKLMEVMWLIGNASCLQEIHPEYNPEARRYHCEQLIGNRKGQFSLRLHGGMRLIFEPNHQPVPIDENNRIDWSQITCVTIVEIVDYH